MNDTATGLNQMILPQSEKPDQELGADEIRIHNVEGIEISEITDRREGETES